ncbi:MAG TPA: hypothetical protein VG733_18005 [Chthoniobacteraceae bacterium]|nr:hypothetical protein [Chthoniobacteraceae bacterium]
MEQVESPAYKALPTPTPALVGQSIDSLLAPALKPKQGPSIPKLIGQLRKEGDNAMSYDAPMKIGGVVTLAQYAALQRWLTNPGNASEIWRTGATTIESSDTAEVALTRKIAEISTDIGASADVSGIIDADGETIDLTIKPKYTGVLGWLSKGSDGKPILTTTKNGTVVFSEGSTDKPLVVSVWDGQTVLVGCDKLELQPGAAGGKPKVVCKGVLIMITVHIVDQHGAKLPDREEEDVVPLPNPSPASPTH